MDTIEKMGKKVIDANSVKTLKEKLEMDDKQIGNSVKILYTTLLQYTKGDARAKVTRGGMKGSWEAYRFIVNKGMDRTVTSIMQKRMRVMNPEQAKNSNEVEAKVQRWKTDIRILLDCGQDQDKVMLGNDDQMITILLSIIPEKVAEHMMSKYDVGFTSVDEMEEQIREYMDKFGENQQQNRVKAIKKVGQAHAGEADEEEDEWTQCWD